MRAAEKCPRRIQRLGFKRKTRIVYTYLPKLLAVSATQACVLDDQMISPPYPELSNEIVMIMDHQCSHGFFEVSLLFQVESMLCP